MIGLLLIALGTGGIKPCVSAFGGDQFEAGQVRFIIFCFFLFSFMEYFMHCLFQLQLLKLIGSFVYFV